MDDIVALADSIYRERVARARRRPIADKILDGGDLFDYASEINRCGIRSQFPHFDEVQVAKELQRRLDIGRKLDRMGRT